MSVDIHQSAWQRAKRDTKHALVSWAFALGASAASIFAGGAAALIATGEDRPSVEVLIGVEVGLGMLIVLTVAVLAFQLCAAPVRQRDELRRAWNRTEPLAGTEISAKLASYASRGDGILKEIQTAGGHSQQHLSEGKEWTDDTSEFLFAHCDPELVTSFSQASRGKRFATALKKQIAVLDEARG